MKDWEKKSEEKQTIGWIFKTFGPYLILYAEYIKDFEKGLPLIQDLYSKNHKLRAVMDEIHVRSKSDPNIINRSLILRCTGSNFLINLIFKYRLYLNVEA